MNVVLVSHDWDVDKVPSNIRAGVEIDWVVGSLLPGDMMQSIIAWVSNTLYETSIIIYPADGTIIVFNKKVLVDWSIRVWWHWWTSWPVWTIYKNWVIVLWPYNQQNGSIDISVVVGDEIKMDMYSTGWVAVNAYMKFDFDFDFSIYTQDI